MKPALFICFLLLNLLSLAQPDTVRMREPDLQTSFEKYELLILAIAGLLLLIGLRFWFRRTRRH